MIQEFKQHIDTSFSFLRQKKLLIACSGGVDSMVLTHLLKQLDFDLALAHCNFTLRGKSSDEDEEFVIEMADTLSIPVFTQTFDTKRIAKENKVSTQMAARELRYNWFKEIIIDFKYDYILTAHHADDDLETFFINLSRGSGLRGLGGIPEVNEQIIRPLLPYSKEEILAFAKSNKIHWREDSTNASDDYLRNKIRLHLIPKFKDLGEMAFVKARESQQHLRASQSLVDDYMALISNLVIESTHEGYRIDIAKLQGLPNTKSLLFELLSPFDFTAWEDVNDLLTGQSGKQLFSKSHRLLKDRDCLLLTEIDVASDSDSVLISADEAELYAPIRLKLEEVKEIEAANNESIFVDADRLIYPLLLRKWQEGDAFQPFGMKGNKKLSKFFKDEKLSLVAKEKTWLLCSDQKIVWVIGWRMDEKFKVAANTKRIIKITRIP